MKKITVVGWHIGNQEDVSPAVIKAIYDADIIVTEAGIDQVHGGWWNNHSDMAGPDGKQLKYMEDNKHKLADYLELEANNEFNSIIDKYEDIILMAFEGMPGVQDPAATFLEVAYQRQDVKIEVVPGPDAVASMIAVSGFGGNGFSFAGFHQGEPEKLVNSLSRFKHQDFLQTPIVLFFRDFELKLILNAVMDVFGADMDIAIGVNLSRRDSIVKRGKVSELIENFTIPNLGTEDAELNKCALAIRNEYFVHSSR